jgi:hypothetical protein
MRREAHKLAGLKARRLEGYEIRIGTQIKRNYLSRKHEITETRKSKNKVFV